MWGEMFLVDEFVEANGGVLDSIIRFPGVVVGSITKPFDEEFKVGWIGGDVELLGLCKVRAVLRVVSYKSCFENGFNFEFGSSG